MFEYFRPDWWCPFLICTNYTVSGGYWIYSLHCAYLFHSYICHGGKAGRAMMIERDTESNGWVAYEGTYNPDKHEFDRIKACFKCEEEGALDDGSYHYWAVNNGKTGQDPNWGSPSMRCLSKWSNEPSCDAHDMAQ